MNPRGDKPEAARLQNGVSTFRGPLLPSRRRSDRGVPASLERWPGFAMIVVAHAIEERYAHEMRDLGVSLRDVVLLAEIIQRPGISQSGLAQRVGLSRSRVSEQLAVLDTAGYIQRHINTMDLRKRKLFASFEAQRVLAEAAERLTAVDRGWLWALSRQERALFTAALHRLPPARTGRLEF